MDEQEVVDEIASPPLNPGNEATKEMQVPFPLYRRIAYGTANFLNLLAVSMWFTYGVGFYQKVLQLPPKSAGTIILVAQVGGAVSTPFIGMWSDGCRCRFPGRRKIFQLVGVIFVAVSFFFIWHSCLGCSTAPVQYQVLYYSSFAIVFEFGWAATQIGQLSLIPELTSDKNVQTELNSIRYGFSISANLLMFSCFWILLEKINKSVDVADLTPDDKIIFWIMAVVVICVGVPVASIFQFCIRERSILRPLPALKWYRWLINPKFYLGACGYAAARIMTLIPQSYIPLYFIDTLGMDKTSIAKGPLVLYIIGFVCTLIVKRFSKIIGAKMTFFVGIVVVWGALIWFWVADPAPKSTSSSVFQWPRDSIYGAIVLLGGGGAIVNVMSMAMIAHNIGPYAGSSAFVYGWVAFADRITNGVTVKIIQQMQPDESSSLPDFYRHVLVFAPFAGSALGLFTISCIKLFELIGQDTRCSSRKHLDIQDSEVHVKSQYGAIQHTT